MSTAGHAGAADDRDGVGGYSRHRRGTHNSQGASSRDNPAKLARAGVGIRRPTEGRIASRLRTGAQSQFEHLSCNTFLPDGQISALVDVGNQKGQWFKRGSRMLLALLALGQGSRCLHADAR
jgi:hypothetical protein